MWTYLRSALGSFTLRNRRTVVGFYALTVGSASTNPLPHHKVSRSIPRCLNASCGKLVLRQPISRVESPPGCCCCWNRITTAVRRAPVGPCRPTRAPSHGTGLGARTHVQAGLRVYVHTATVSVLFTPERRLESAELGGHWRQMFSEVVFGSRTRTRTRTGWKENRVSGALSLLFV